MYIKTFLQKLFLFGMAFYLINFLILYFSNTKSLNIKFHLMHLFFLLLNSIALIIVSKIFEKSKDIVGMSFLVISTILTIIVFIVGKFIFAIEITYSRWNYFSLYIAYLFSITFLIGQKLNQTKF
jgi:hypothetical protein